MNEKDLNKREYNSERRRKQTKIKMLEELFIRIRENITPRGDGNLSMNRNDDDIANI